MRLIVDREAEVQAFIPDEYWSLEADFKGANPPPFTAKLFRIDNKKAVVTNGTDAQTVVDACNEGSYAISDIVRKQRKRNPPPPFTTSKLQQAAAQRLRVHGQTHNAGRAETL